ncbi:MAG: hypothetical protein ABIJ96_12965 [Elusimicrobiota bacterium]
MKVLFIADRPADLNPRADTTLYMLREVLRRDMAAYYAVPERVYWSGTELLADAEAVESCAKHALPVLGRRERLSFAGGIDAVFIRKDPPFDLDYISLCWLLTAYEEKVRMINRPSLLLRYHEKMPPYAAAAAGKLRADDVVPACLASRLEQITAFVEALDAPRIILKPWLGYGGRGIRRVARDEFLKAPGSFGLGKERWMVQPYLEAVERTGDRRGFFFNGRYCGSIVRMPKPGGFVSNLAQGGTAVKQELSAKERALVARIESWLKGSGIVFAGSDFIDGRLSELNITSPTGFASYEELYGGDPSAALIDAAFAERR